MNAATIERAADYLLGVRSRLKASVVGLLFWLVFTVPALAALALQLVGIVVYVLTGSAFVRNWVYQTGKGIDGFNNAAWFAGSPKETISSHTGRWYASGRADIPKRFRFVRWLTDLFERGHAVRAIEEPFKDFPL